MRIESYLSGLRFPHFFLATMTLSSAFKLRVPKTSNITGTALCKSSYHPLFSSPNGDVVLRSKEGTLYRLHSYTLRASSGLFDTMFSLPQPKICRLSHNYHYSTSDDTRLYPDILDVYEANFPMAEVLKLIHGIPTPLRMTFDEIEAILALAEKWDTQGAIENLRSVFSSPQFIDQHSIRCYILSRHYGWDYEARLASTRTLTLNLYEPIHAHSLDQLSSKDLRLLLDLHRKRRDMFRQLLNSPERFPAGNRYV